MSAKCRRNVGEMSVKCRWNVGEVSVKCRWGGEAGKFPGFIEISRNFLKFSQFLKFLRIFRISRVCSKFPRIFANFGIFQNFLEFSWIVWNFKEFLKSVGEVSVKCRCSVGEMPVSCVCMLAPWRWARIWPRASCLMIFFRFIVFGKVACCCLCSHRHRPSQTPHVDPPIARTRAAENQMMNTNTQNTNLGANHKRNARNNSFYQVWVGSPKWRGPAPPLPPSFTLTKAPAD